MNKIAMDELCRLVAVGLEVDESEIDESTTAEAIDDWDSLGHIQILTELREHFGDDYQEKPEIASATSVAEMFSILNGG